MQYRRYGKTGAEVSILGYGAMRLPSHEDGTCDLEKSVPMLQRGIDLGINYIDTAYVYINGTSEVAVGKAIKKYDRDKLFLATKIPTNEEKDSAGDEWKRKLDESLKRFDTDYIDFILFHGLNWESFSTHITQKGRAFDVAQKAKAEGLVRHLCFSSHDTPENIIRLIDTQEFEAVLMQYNYLDRHNEPAIEHAAKNDLGVAIMGPVAGGRLAIPDGTIKDEEGVLEVKTPELALRFTWNNPAVSVSLSGMNSYEQIEENIATAEAHTELNEEDNQRIIELIEKNQKLSDLYCTGCEYCLPCPNDVNIPENFRYMNWFRVWGMEKQAKEAYAALGEKEEGVWTPWAGVVKGLKAEACLECGDCEPKCPQNIPIIDQLKEVSNTLGK